MIEKVTVYSKPNCVNCERTKKLMKELDIDFTEINMMDDPAALEFVKSKGFREAPVIITDKGEWSGFKPDNIHKIKNSQESEDSDIWV